MLVRVLGVKPEGKAGFADIAAGKWYASYVAAASRLGIVKGRSDTAFAPNDPISREEMAVMIIRAHEVKKGLTVQAAAQELTFADRSQISKWAAESVIAAAELKLVQGKPDGSFAPKGKMTRAESAQVIYNLLGK